MREPVGPRRAVANLAKRARRRIVARQPLAPRPDPQHAGAVAQQRADPIAADRRRQRRVVPQAVDDLERRAVDDVDAAAEVAIQISSGTASEMRRPRSG